MKVHFKRWYVMAAFFLGTSLSLYTPRASAQSSETEERGMVLDVARRSSQSFPCLGLFLAAWQMRVAPIVEYHTGFSYAPVDMARNYVGVPYSDRFRYPSFFSADARVSKDVKVNYKYSLRFSLSVLNMTNHFNALDVYANTGDPHYGTFIGNSKPKFGGDFDVLL